MIILTDEERDMLRAIAERIRDECSVVGYGYFLGGNPNNFFPDAEMCSEKEIESHRRACELYNSGSVQDVAGNNHSPVVNAGGDVIGWSTHPTFGIGSYSIEDGDVVSLSQRLDEWVDEARQLEGRYAQP